MTTPFSRDQPGPRPRFRPGPGQLGEHAATQSLKPPPARQRGQGRQARQPRQSRQGAPLGMGRPQERETDNSHLLYGAMHHNIQSLGRELPFGLWAIQNGYFADLAPGKEMVDWLD